jgi:hypothetical protein
MIPARGLGPNVVSMRAYQVQREIANVERWAAARSGQDRLRLSGLGTLPRNPVGYCAPWHDWRVVNPFLPTGVNESDVYRLRSVGSGGFTFDSVTHPSSGFTLGWPAGVTDLAPPSSASPCDMPSVGPLDPEAGLPWMRRTSLTGGMIGNGWAVGFGVGALALVVGGVAYARRK